MKKLTQAEEQIMQALWTLGEGGFLKDILENLPEPRAHHNTVATLLKILVEKQVVGIRNPNRNNFYFPLISKEAYTEQRLLGLTERFFEGSYPNVISFLVDRKQMSVSDLELLLQQLKNKENE
ncbi:MAG TPA: BlaI/MecI/CopY family transcriptional regulator [Sediminibacterium sp.]|nr:BlaI/MecI/CopY family transcriptional regulator [Sediminibacterium sp.]